LGPGSQTKHFIMKSWVEIALVITITEKTLMRSPIPLASLILLLLVSNPATSSGQRFAAPAQGPPRFSSVYSALTNCGSGMTRKEEREAEKHGSDIPTRCKGFGGYSVDVSYSACSSSFSLVKGEDSISLGMQAMRWKQKTVEWRLADGKPFAVIMRVYDYAGNDECATGGKITGESLIIRGLKGFEIDETVDVKSTPNPNLKARELADKGYARTKS
jgi:hypothetical protein